LIDLIDDFDEIYYLGVTTRVGLSAISFSRASKKDAAAIPNPVTSIYYSIVILKN